MATVGLARGHVPHDTTTYQTAWAVASCVIFPCGPRRRHASATLSAG